MVSQALIEKYKIPYDDKLKKYLKSMSNPDDFLYTAIFFAQKNSWDLFFENLEKYNNEKDFYLNINREEEKKKFEIEIDNKVEQKKKGKSHYKCVDKKCDGIVNYQALQTRSGDEQTPVYFQCELCRKTWVR